MRARPGDLRGPELPVIRHLLRAVRCLLAHTGYVEDTATDFDPVTRVGTSWVIERRCLDCKLELSPHAFMGAKPRPLFSRPRS